MENKIVLAELKEIWEYLNDIIDNGYISQDEREELASVTDLISSIYNRIWSVAYKNGEDLAIPKKYQDTENKTILIGESVEVDYSIVDNTNGNLESEYLSCGDIDYYWYKEEN